MRPPLDALGLRGHKDILRGSFTQSFSENVRAENIALEVLYHVEILIVFMKLNETFK